MSFDTIIKGCNIVLSEKIVLGSVGIENGRIAALLAPDTDLKARYIILANGLFLLPGIIDIHCHIRAPAYPERASVESETLACAAGGITTVFEMPITNPCCNSPSQIKLRKDHFIGKSAVDFALYAAPRELNKKTINDLADSGIVAFKIFTTTSPIGREAEFDGLTWPEEADQLKALNLIAETGLPIVVHAESASLLRQAAIDVKDINPAMAKIHGLSRPASAEALAVAKLLTLNMTAKAKLHIAHVSSALTVDVLRRFHGSSDFTAETCPHYLRYTEKDVEKSGVAAKINPPIRKSEDRKAIWQAIEDGIISHVTTDHATYTKSEKLKYKDNFLLAPPGHPGIETMLPIMLDALSAGSINLHKISALMSTNPAHRFGLKDRGIIEVGKRADLVLIDIAKKTNITQNSLLTSGKDNALLNIGESFNGRLEKTILNGTTIWELGSKKIDYAGAFVSPALDH